MSSKDLERRDNLGEGGRSVRNPLLVVLSTVDNDDKVIVLALEENLGAGSLSTSHFGGLFVWCLLKSWGVSGRCFCGISQAGAVR